MSTKAKEVIRIQPGQEPEQIKTKTEAAKLAGYTQQTGLNYVLDTGRPARDGALYYTAEKWEVIQQGEAEHTQERAKELSPAPWPFDAEKLAEPEKPAKPKPTAPVVTAYPKTAQRFIQDCRESLAGLPAYISKRMTVSAEEEGEVLRVTCILELPRGGTFFSDGDYLHNRGWKWVESDEPLMTIKFVRVATGKAAS